MGGGRERGGSLDHEFDPIVLNISLSCRSLLPKKMKGKQTEFQLISLPSSNITRMFHTRSS